MSYQALLFCPDEKTARVITQVLSELEFNVAPCTEPFAAVKKLMGERFDAIVVDCDNEQNATLLFKSARSAPNNQSALAVAVVEGQAGVAKAFRIGANLVLTKPINVEQAKGTLRVARGLLRKNEGTKTGSPVVVSAAKFSPIEPASNHVSTTATPAMAAPAPVPVVPIIPASGVAAASVLQAQAVSASSATEETKPEGQAIENSSAPATAPHFKSAQSIASKIVAASAAAPVRPISSGSAASAPAPARETKPASLAEEIPAAATESKKQTAEVGSAVSDASPATATAASSLSFGGAADVAKPKSGGSKTTLIAAVAVVVIAAVSYAAWTKFASTKTSASVAPAVSQPTVVAQPTAAAPVHTTSMPSGSVSAPATAEIKSRESEGPEPTKSTSSAKSSGHSAKASTAETASEVQKPAPVETAENSSPAAHPMVIKTDRSRLTVKSADSVEAPALSVAAAVPSSAALPDLMGANSAPTPVLQRLVISQGVSRGLLVKEVQPMYPRTALVLRVEGSVQLMATVSKNGNISDVKIVSGDKDLAHAAVDAVKQWRYKPYLLNGEPVDIQTQITVNFKLPR